MLNNLKLMLGIADSDRDGLLELIISGVTSRLKVLLGGIEPPDTLSYIVLNVSIIRFNKIGSEGMAIHTVEGESQHFTDNDFAGFMSDIEAWLTSREGSTQGKVRFL